MTSKHLPIVSLTRRETFSAAHRLWADDLTDAENEDLFGACARPHGHGHNYVLIVTLRGPVNPKTGILINLVDLKKAILRLIIDKVDHRHLNVDVEICAGINPTTENLAVLFWNILHVQFGALLHEIQLFETEKNGVIYNGHLQTNVFQNA
jgi:6-pyruvoyltetrahydropterin/6-carboxytetrahydropterin synthase